MMRIRAARPSDEQAIRDLLEANDLPTTDLPAPVGSMFFVAEDRGRIEGVVGLEVESSVALLRSLATSREVREQGIGKALVAAAEAWAVSTGITTLWLLTTTSSAYFERLGYRQAARGEAPAFIRNTRQFQALCPASAILMEKRL